MASASSRTPTSSLRHTASVLSPGGSQRKRSARDSAARALDNLSQRGGPSSIPAAPDQAPPSHDEPAQTQAPLKGVPVSSWAGSSQVSRAAPSSQSGNVSRLSGTPQAGRSSRETREAQERAALIASIQACEKEGKELEGKLGDIRRKRRRLESKVETDEGLQKRLREIDDDSLTALLTDAADDSLSRSILASASAASAPPSLEELLAPSLSAGIEGTGSGREIDAHLRKLYERSGTEDAEREAWLDRRRQRGDILASHLQSFTGVTINHFSQRGGTPPKQSTSRTAGRHTSHLRSIDLSGTFTTFGPFSAHFELVEEDTVASTSSGPLPAQDPHEKYRNGPQIRRLRVEIPEVARNVLERDGHLTRIIDTANLPCLFLSLRTLRPLARIRRQLFLRLAQTFPALCKEHLAKLRSRGGSLNSDDLERVDGSDAATQDGETSDAQSELARRLYDPDLAETLAFKNARGATLILTFAVTFSAAGHARSRLSLSVSVPPSLRLTAPAKELVHSMPARFQTILANPPTGRDGGDAISEIDARLTLITAVVSAFFDATPAPTLEAS